MFNPLVFWNVPVFDRKRKNCGEVIGPSQKMRPACIRCSRIVGESNDHIVQNRVEVQKARGNIILQSLVNISEVRISLKNLKLWFELRQSWLIIFRQFVVGVQTVFLQQSWLIATIVIALRCALI